MGRPAHRSPAKFADALTHGAWLLALTLLVARASAAPCPQEREHIEPATAATSPAWLQRALAHRQGALPPGALTDDPHASALTVELVVEADPDAPRMELSQLVVEVSFVARDPGAPSWTTVARADPDGRATFARVPEGRPHVLVLAPDAARVPLVPDPTRYGLLFEPFRGGPFPHLALDEIPTEGGARLVRLHLVPGRAADGAVELFEAPLPTSSASPRDASREGALAWVASPGWLQLAPLGSDGVFRWFDPRPAPAAPFDPAAPSAGFLERLIGGVAGPLDAAGGVWRVCTNVPAPPVGHTFVIELASERAVERARGADDAHNVPESASESRPGARSAPHAAALARWRALRAVPLDVGSPAPSAPDSPNRAALARELLDRAPASDGLELCIEEACRWELEPADGAPREWRGMYREQQALLGLAREWSALGPLGSEEVELGLLDRAEKEVEALLRPFTVLFSTHVLQLWIDVVAPRYPRYAEALAAHDPWLRAPRRNSARGALPERLEELDAEGILAALRKRPSSTLGAELAPFLRTAPRDAAQRLLAGFAALARDEARGPAVQSGAVDLLLALGARTSGDGPALAELVLAALGDEASDVALTEAVLAALAPLAPARALTDARAALDAYARDVERPAAALQSAAGRSGARPDPAAPHGSLLVLAALAPTELASRARAAPELATFAAAALLLEGADALDARGLPHAFLERLLR